MRKTNFKEFKQIIKYAYGEVDYNQILHMLISYEYALAREMKKLTLNSDSKYSQIRATKNDGLVV